MKYTSIKISTTGLDKEKDELLRFIALDFEVDDTLKPYQSKLVNELDMYILPKKDFSVDPKYNSFTKDDVLSLGVQPEQAAKVIKSCIENHNITGFNLDNFDLSFIYSYLKRYGISLDLSNVLTFDTFHMDSLLYPRTFEGICNRYTGTALTDTETKDALLVAKHNIDLFAVEFIQSRERGFLADIGMPVLSPEHFVALKGESLVFCNGKHQNEDVAEVCKKDPSYIRWLFGIATDITKKTVQEYFYKKYPKTVK